MSKRRRRGLAPSLNRAWRIAAAGGLLLGAWIGVSAAPAGADVVAFHCTGSAQSWTVPAGVTSATFDVLGAAGGNGNFGDSPQNAVPGNGGEAKATISVTPGSVISINVGCQGQVGTAGDSSTAGSAVGGVGGFGDGTGGSGGSGTFGAGGGGGGGSSVVQAGIRVVVAGGGGGAAPSDLTTAGSGGTGGGSAGSPGQGGNVPGTNGGGGGTSGGPGSGGCGPSCAGVGANGGPGGNITGVAVQSGAGGGGGLFGGGGGAPEAGESAGGGGGSGLCPTTCLVFQNGVQPGDGLVTITFSAAPAAIVVAPRFTG